jgi:formamidopyrimidine-DNA glycosylase
MPELPDVEAFRRHLDATSLHRRVERVRVHDTAALQGLSRQRLQRALAGRRLRRSHRHGKHLFGALTGGGWLVMHFGMTGRLEYDEGGDRPPRHTRLTVQFADGSRLAFVDQRKLGFVSLARDVEEFVAAERLGPDALDLSLTGLRDLLRTRRGSVKSALMNQAAVAGIGNVYSDEICFQARLDPRTPATSLQDTAVRRLHRRLGGVLHTAADRGADPARVPRGWLLAHREDGAPCPRGNGTVRKISMSGRGAFYCPSCQPG